MGSEDKPIRCQHPERHRRYIGDKAEWCERCGAIRTKLGYCAAAEQQRSWSQWYRPMSRQTEAKDLMPCSVAQLAAGLKALGDKLVIIRERDALVMQVADLYATETGSGISIWVKAP